MKQFRCGTLVPGCTWETSAEKEAEAIRRAVDHLRTAHHEGVVRETMVENIKSRIRDSETTG